MVMTAPTSMMARQRGKQREQESRSRAYDVEHLNSAAHEETSKASAYYSDEITVSTLTGVVSVWNFRFSVGILRSAALAKGVRIPILTHYIRKAVLLVELRIDSSSTFLAAPPPGSCDCCFISPQAF
jgi:hypothetical protein